MVTTCRFGFLLVEGKCLPISAKTKAGLKRIFNVRFFWYIEPTI